MFNNLNALLSSRMLPPPEPRTELVWVHRRAVRLHQPPEFPDDKGVSMAFTVGLESGILYVERMEYWK